MKASISCLSANRHRLLLLSIIPASLNKDSEATEDGGADKDFLASAANMYDKALFVVFPILQGVLT